MIAFEFKVNGKTKTAVMPESWEEVTLEQIIALDKARKEKSDDPLLIMAALSGVKLSELNNTPTNLWKPFFDHLQLLTTSEPKWTTLKHAKSIRLNAKDITVPSDLGMESFGQKVMAFQLMEKFKDNELEGIPDILALYFQKLYDGEFHRSRIDTIKRYCLQMKALQAVPIANFFFHHLLKSRSIGLLGLNWWSLIQTRKPQLSLQVLNALKSSVSLGR